MIGAGASKLALFQSKPNPPGPTPDDEDAVDWHRVAWRTDEAGFAAAQARLKKLGVAFHGPVDHGIAESIYFRDPDGHRLEITWYRNSKSS
jgi:catechol-2,3-dioxygenase